LSSNLGRRLHLTGEFVAADLPRLPDGGREIFSERLFEGPEQRFLQRVVVGQLYRGSRADKIWTAADETAFLERAPAHLHLPLVLALWTGQRQGDLLRLPWSAYDGAHIRLRQGKTGTRVVIPVGAPLKTALDATPKRSPLILTNSDGKPWTSDGFRASWGKACKTAGVIGVTFHDLRGTAVTRLAIAGCTEAEIATITGHSLRSVRAILDTHYLARDPALGESAIRKLERGTKTPN
jgi:integrase